MYRTYFNPLCDIEKVEDTESMRRITGDEDIRSFSFGPDAYVIFILSSNLYNNLDTHTTCILVLLQIHHPPNSFTRSLKLFFFSTRTYVSFESQAMNELDSKSWFERESWRFVIM